MRVVVIGAGGFVGGWVAEELSSRRGVEIVACVRKWASAVRVARRGIDIRQFDLESSGASARDVISGADVVINATMPSPSREPDLAAGLYEACSDVDVRKLVHFSSAAVYGEKVGVVDESGPPAPNDDYSRGKALTEERLLLAAQRGGAQVIILRPSIIYGPFSDAWSVRYAQRITRGRWRTLGPLGEGCCNLIHAHDVAKAAFAAAVANTPNRTTICNINSPEKVTWNQYIDRFGEALGVEHRVTPNTAMFRTVAVAADLLRAGSQWEIVRAFYRKSKPVGAARTAMTSAQTLTKLYPSSSELRLLRRKVYYASEHAEQTIGFSCGVKTKDGLEQTAKWCAVHGIV